MPDNVLFADQAGEVFEILMEDCDLHTVLRCPRGTFSPYTQGTKTNVVFFTKGEPTERIWIYDARANVPKITKKGRPLTPAHFAEFEQCFGDDPNGQYQARRVPTRPRAAGAASPSTRLRRNHYKLDAFKWLRDEDVDDPDELPEPEELITEAMEELAACSRRPRDMQRLLERGTGGS